MSRHKWTTLTPRERARAGAGPPAQARPLPACLHALISDEMFLNSVYKSEFPHKSIILFSTLQVKVKLGLQRKPGLHARTQESDSERERDIERERERQRTRERDSEQKRQTASEREGTHHILWRTRPDRVARTLPSRPLTRPPALQGASIQAWNSGISSGGRTNALSARVNHLDDQVDSDQ